jgi:hypothetical protein
MQTFPANCQSEKNLPFFMAEKKKMLLKLQYNVVLLRGICNGGEKTAVNSFLLSLKRLGHEMNMYLFEGRKE